MIAVGYSLIGLAAFAVGVTAGIRAERDRQSTNRADDLADKYRQGYADGYTTGRINMGSENAAKALHPTAHPVGRALRIFKGVDE